MVVQEGTKRYKTVQEMVYGGTGRYKNGSEQYLQVHTGTFWDVLIITAQPGYAFLLDSLLQFCPAGSAVFETNVSSSMFQSRQKCRPPAATVGGLRFGSRPFGGFCGAG